MRQLQNQPRDQAQDQAQDQPLGQPHEQPHDQPHDQPSLLWDIFCRVIDNLGDAGVCWRLAADLGARGDRVRLVIDEPAPLAWMAPQGAPGVQVLAWPAGDAVLDGVADVVIEAFGCDPPPAYVGAMALAPLPPCWINLEYLSAEAYVERSHGLPSPQQSGLPKWFFYPGFTPHTGGLLREPGLMAQRAAFDRDAWLQTQGSARRPGERIVTLFCYGNAPVDALLQTLAATPTLLLLTPGHAQDLVRQSPHPKLRLHALPWLPQTDFDRLLWSADLNLVRGEDSLVRAIWAGAPFIWQAYPQSDGAHAAKIDALIARLGLPHDVAQAWRAWNGLAPWRGLAPGLAWQQATHAARDTLLQQPDLCTALLAFVRGQPRAGADTSG